MADFRRFVETSCFECVVDVAAWTDRIGDWDYGNVTVGLLSPHDLVEWRSWRGRLRRAIRAIRGGEYPWLELGTGTEVAALADALRDAGAAVFPVTDGT